MYFVPQHNEQALPSFQGNEVPVPLKRKKKKGSRGQFRDRNKPFEEKFYRDSSRGRFMRTGFPTFRPIECTLLARFAAKRAPCALPQTSPVPSPRSTDWPKMWGKTFALPRHSVRFVHTPRGALQGHCIHGKRHLGERC